MESAASERTVSFGTRSTSAPPRTMNRLFPHKQTPTRVTGAVAPGYAQLSPSTGSLRVRRVASRQRMQGGASASGACLDTTSMSGGVDGSMSTSPHLAALTHRHGEDPLVSLLHQPRSVDSMLDIASTASPVLQSPVGGYPSGSGIGFPTGGSRDSVTMQELLVLQHQHMQQQQQQQQQMGVTVIYPQGASPSDAYMRAPDYPGMQELQSNGDDSANEDRVQVRVEGYFESTNVNVLIPNDLPPSTLLYVLTASDGRDLMFKLTQYSLQLTICFLKMPSLFSPEVQAFTGPWAERLYRNYNTIRHGRSLFKLGRGLLNLFTFQTVCERMWLKYEGAVSRGTCAALLPAVTMVERALLRIGVAPSWGRAMSRHLLRWSQAAELTPGQQRRLEESPASLSLDWRIQERMHHHQQQQQDADHSTYPGTLLADDTFMHVSEAERGAALHTAVAAASLSGAGAGGSNSTSAGGAGSGRRRSSSTTKQAAALQNIASGVMGGSFAGLALHNAMTVMGLSGHHYGAASRAALASALPSQPVPTPSVRDDDSTSLDISSRQSPQSVKGSFALDTTGRAGGGSSSSGSPIESVPGPTRHRCLQDGLFATGDGSGPLTAAAMAEDETRVAAVEAEAAAAGVAANSTANSNDDENNNNNDDKASSASGGDGKNGGASPTSHHSSPVQQQQQQQQYPAAAADTYVGSKFARGGRPADDTTSSSADYDDAPRPAAQTETPPFLHGTLPQELEHGLLHGMTPSRNTAATQPTLSSYHQDALHLPHSTADGRGEADDVTVVEDAAAAAGSNGGGGGGGRMTLLRPLPRPAQNSSATDPDGSVTCDDPFHSSGVAHGDEEEGVGRGSSSMTAVAAPAFMRDPLSMPDSWRPEMAPTVPPSQSDDYGFGGTMRFPDSQPMLSGSGGGSGGAHGGGGGARTTPPPQSLASPPPPPVTAHTGTRAAYGDHGLISSSDGDTVAGLKEASAMTAIGSVNGSPRHRSKKECPPFEVVPALPTHLVAASLPASESSSLTALQRPLDSVGQGGGGGGYRSSSAFAARQEREANESDMSILSSAANSSFHVRPSGTSGAMTTWLNELQPASAALPARVRKGILQFNPVLMTLLGIRNLAAAFRRFLRDATLISTERFVTVTFVELHRRAITRFINRCWLIVSVIDLLLNTVRLLQPGWVKYATARQNIRCRCGCQGDDDPADTVWRTHGFIARRKTDLFFPPLNLDYGAPMVSTVAFMEAADPARLMPACSRCGCLYKELPSEAMEGEVGEGGGAAAAAGGAGTAATSLMVAGGSALNRSSAPRNSLSGESPSVSGGGALPLTRQSQLISEEGDRTHTAAAAAAMEREKPRWVQMYEAELQEAEEKRRRSTGSGMGARRETMKPGGGSGPHNSTEAEAGKGGKFHGGEIADLVPPPPLTHAADGANGAVVGGRPQLQTLQSRDTEDSGMMLAGAGSHKPRHHQVAQLAEPAEEESTGILFVPWMMRKFFDYVWLLRVHPNLSATLLMEARCLAEFYLAYRYCFGDYETYVGDAPLTNILHPYGAIAGIVSAAVGLLRVVEAAPTS